ncbi:MAG: ankyrin repeat domain-containing protein [Gemmataceae bacterium]|nr:ankyrin repeat domain-containing protein [Gemmataceae bacterium]
MTPHRRQFAALGAGLLVSGAARADEPKTDLKPKPVGPVEAPFTRDYPAPKFQPSWKKPQINRQLVQDFVMYGHGDLPMVKKLLEKEPALLNATVDWGGGDFETALGGASHIGHKETIHFLLEMGARPDIFTLATLGQLDAIKALLTLQPKLIDAKGPHGLGLHLHASMGGADAAKTLEYLQSIKKVELKKPMKK